MEFESGKGMEYFDNRNENGDIHRMCRGIIHVVKEGDTLYKIAQMHHVGVSELMYENPYVNIYQLHPGDEICVPVAQKK